MNQQSNVSDQLHSKNKKEKEVTKIHLFLISCSIVLYIVDFISDIEIAVNHFIDGNMWYFIQTVCSIIIPAVILTLFNIWWYKIDATIDTSKVSTEQRVLRILFIILMMAPLLRNFEALYYAIKGYWKTDIKVKKDCYLRMISFIADAAILTVFEAFLENGPQVLLQTCLFAKLQASYPNVFTETEMWQVGIFLISTVSIAFSYASYQRNLRLSLHDKADLDLPTVVFLTVQRFFDVASRVIALGLFASVFPYYLLLVCCIHFLGMFTWIRLMKTNFCDNYIGEIIYNLVLAEMFVFFYFNPKEGPTKQRYIAFYVLMFLENTTLISVWYYYYSPAVNFRFSALIAQPSCFLMAIILLILYYLCMHPTKGTFNQKYTVEEKTTETEMLNCEANINACEIEEE